MSVEDPLIEESSDVAQIRRLRQFLMFSAPFGPIGLAITLGVYWYWRIPAVTVMITAVFFYMLLIWYGLRLTREGRLQGAVLCYAAGTWALSLGLGILFPTIFGLTVMVALLPVMIALSYATRETLLRVIVASTLIVAVGAVFTLLNPLFPPSESMLFALTVIGSVTVVILVAQTGLSIYNSNGTLLDVVSSVKEANAALQDSERGLETKVRERTEELAEKALHLEESQRQLAAARDTAMEANQAKSSFLANMSHELRTPLNAIIGYSEMLQEEARDDDNEGYIPDLEKILTSGKYLLTLINGVLDLSKVEAGKMDVYLEEIELTELIRSVTDTVQPLIRDKGNRIEVSGVENAGSMNSDVTKLRQVLFNLLSNASKFTSEGTVTLSVERSTRDGNDWLRFQVRDTGIGMTPDQLDKIFEAFAQAEASTTREFGGTGLGLSITQKFCELLGGSIEAESEPGAGSCFTVLLPAQAPQTVVPAAEASAPREAATGVEGASTILVVDDDPAALDLVSRFLSREGYGVLRASNGEEALRLAREHHPDLITLDVIMPQMDGWAVLGELKADPALAEIPVILVTMTDDRNLGYTLGASEFITKPIDWEHLAGVIRRLQVPSKDGLALVVDDDPQARELMCRGLGRGGWRLAEAENGRAALERVAAETPHLILLDLMMPEMDGFEFVEALRAREEWRRIPVIVVTAKSITPEDRARLHGNVSKVLQKGSYGRDELLAEVSKVVGERTGRTA